MSFIDQYSNEAIMYLCQDAIEKLEKVKAESNKQKKHIIVELAKSLEGKIPTDTICLEITTQLRGKVSESLVRKYLDEKYKDGRRSRNAKQQNQYHFNESKPESEELGTKEEENSVIGNKDDNLALPVALNPDIIVIDSSGQALIQRGKEKASDDEDNNEVDLGLNVNSNTKNIPTIGSDELAKIPEQELLLQPELIECCNCKKLTIENLKLKEALLKSTQFVSADKIATVNANNKRSPNSIIDLRYPITFRSISEYLDMINAKEK